jgi:multiple sugar transport system substrate-binding protein
MSTTTHRWWRLLAVLLTFTLIAVACGSDDDDSSSEETSTEEEAPAEEPAEEEPAEEPAEAEEMALISDECPIPEPSESVTLDLIGWEFPVTVQYALEFEACNSDNLTVNVQYLASEDAKDAMALDLSTGSPEFEINQNDNGTLGTHAENLVDLTPYIEQYGAEFGLDDISDPLWAAATIDGRIVGVPVTQNTLHFFYNSEILAEHGVTPPTTFAELIEACGVLKEAGFDDPFNMNFSADWSNRIEFFNTLYSLGGKYFNDDLTPAFNSPEGLAAVEHFLKIRDACMSSAGLAFSIDDAQAALQAGELPMASIWASRAAEMDDEEISLVVGLIEFDPSLYTEEGSLRNGTAFVDFYSIPIGTSVDPEIIFKVIMAATDLQSQNAAAAFATVSRASASNPDGPRNTPALNQSVAEGVGSVPSTPALPLAETVIGEELLEVLQNDADPATALANAAARYIEEATDAGFL